MSAPIRQQLIDAVAAKLGSIAPGAIFMLPDGPYVCENSIRTVTPWRKVPFSKTECPAVKFEDDDAKTTPGPSTKHEHKLRFELEIHVVGGTPAAAARSIMADVVACLGSDPRWGGLAYWTDLDDHILDVQQAGDVIAGAQIHFTITYRTPLWRI